MPGPPAAAHEGGHEPVHRVRPSDRLTPETRHTIAGVFDRYGGSDIRVFGSVARGTDRPGSDLDLIAHFPTGFSLFGLVELEDDLETLLGCRVDVVSDDDRQGRALAGIRETAIPLLPPND